VLLPERHGEPLVQRFLDDDRDSRFRYSLRLHEPWRVE